MRREKNYHAEHWEGEKNILPTMFLEKKNSCWPEITHHPLLPQKLNGRPLSLFEAAIGHSREKRRASEGTQTESPALPRPLFFASLALLALDRLFSRLTESLEQGSKNCARAPT